MAVDNRVQFAIVREDPEVERAVIDHVHAKTALLIASGGCTAFTLAAQRPDVSLTLLDMNDAQLDLVRTKHAALIAHAAWCEERTRLFCTDGALNGCGNFESLFRGWRAVLDDLVMPDGDRHTVLLRDGERGRLTQNKYWPESFEMFFGDAMLEAMFTSAATQHAPRGSYPTYFQNVIERGLARSDASKNPWLHHVLLGHYVDGVLPTYLGATYDASASFAYVHASIADAPHFGAFDVVSLSNLFDWMPSDAIANVARRLVNECHAGAAVIVRQLNNCAPVEELFAPAFTLDAALSSELHANDRSMFYQRLLVLVRNA